MKNHPFTPLAMVDAIKCFWNIIKNNNMGIVMTTAKANTCPHCTGNVWNICAIPTEIGRTAFPRVTIVAHSTSPHEPREHNIRTLTNVGLERGTTMLVYILI